MLELIENRPHDRLTDYPCACDLREMLAIPTTQAATRLWVAPDDRLAGFAILNDMDTSARLDFEIAPAYFEGALAGQIVGWAEFSNRQARLGRIRLACPGDRLPF